MAFAWNVAEALPHREADSEAMLWRPTRGVLVTRVTFVKEGADKTFTIVFLGVHYLVRSKVVAMLISVAALSMGRDLDATTDRAAFLRQLDATLGAG